jgi:hypothetical protein
MYKPSEDKFVVRALLDGEIFFPFSMFFFKLNYYLVKFLCNSCVLNRANNPFYCTCFDDVAMETACPGAGSG